MGRRVAVAATAVLGALAVACSSGGSAVDSSSTTPVTEAPPPRRNLDGQLVLGVLLPSEGAGLPVADGMRTGIDEAVAQINAAGGVNGRAVVVRRQDEGADAAVAGRAIETLIDAGVDAVVGPASSRTAGALLERSTRAGVAVCALSGLPTGPTRRPESTLVISTLPSDALQGTALGQALVQTGARRAVILHPSDGYGARVADAALGELRAQGIDGTRVAYDPRSPNPAEVAGRVQRERPAAVAVIGNPEPGGRVLAALSGLGQRPPDVPVYLSDGFRQPELASIVASGRPEALEGYAALTPTAEPPTAWFRDLLGTEAAGRSTSYSAYAYDCVNLIALAAVGAGSDDAERLAARVVDVSRGGVGCRDFPTCAPLLADGRNIDLQGASGDLDLDEFGMRSDALFDVVRYDRDGRDRLVRTLSVRRT